MTKVIADYRSDTLTKPSLEMREAMADAELGDDVYGEDPTVNRLEQTAAAMAGKEAAVFASSGTQTNLLALLSHCQRGDEYIVGQDAHTYKYEGGGAAVLGSIQPQPLEFEADGSLDLDRVAAAIKPDDSHYAKSRLLCLENTQSGKVLSLSYQSRARELCEKYDLGLHLDGARAFNAAVKLGVQLTDITQYYDSVSLCLSKGLGAPIGSVLCGDTDLIARARRWRKMLGGGMRQAGMLAAAGEYALQNNVARLQIDHDNAIFLAQGLEHLPGLECSPAVVETNMLFVCFPTDEMSAAWQRHMALADIRVASGRQVRLVTHCDIDRAAIESTIEHAQSFAF
ncbi:MAG: threonine aldolase [Halieaceae bacterium]|jgi:threonine aldolase